MATTKEFNISSNAVTVLNQTADAAENTAKGFTSMKAELRALQNQMLSMDQTSEEFQKASKRAAELKDNIGDLSAEIGSADGVNRDIERTTKLLVAQVNLVGIQRPNFEIRHEGRGFRTFVQLRYSLDDSNRLLIEKIQNDKKLEMALRKSAAFRELEESVNKVNKQNEPVIVSPVPPATTDETAKPVSFKVTLDDSPKVDNTPVKVSN